MVGIWLLLVAHPPRAVRARRDAEPRDGRLRGRADGARRHAWLSASAAGIAGLARLRACRRSATSAPTSGQGYIVDSFMVVVLGGVGQLAGTVYAALGLGS